MQGVSSHALIHDNTTSAWLFKLIDDSFILAEYHANAHSQLTTSTLPQPHLSTPPPLDAERHGWLVDLNLFHPSEELLHSTTEAKNDLQTKFQARAARRVLAAKLWRELHHHRVSNSSFGDLFSKRLATMQLLFRSSDANAPSPTITDPLNVLARRFLDSKFDEVLVMPASPWTTLNVGDVVDSLDGAQLSELVSRLSRHPPFLMRKQNENVALLDAAFDKLCPVLDAASDEKRSTALSLLTLLTVSFGSPARLIRLVQLLRHQPELELHKAVSEVALKHLEDHNSGLDLSVPWREARLFFYRESRRNPPTTARHALTTKQVAFSAEATLSLPFSAASETRRTVSTTRGGLACDGSYLYTHGSPTGLRRIGTGLNGTTRGQVYTAKPLYRTGEHVHLALVAGSLFALSPAMQWPSVEVLDPATLEVRGAVRLGVDPEYGAAQSVQPGGACLSTDGRFLYLLNVENVDDAHLRPWRSSRIERSERRGKSSSKSSSKPARKAKPAPAAKPTSSFGAAAAAAPPPPDADASAPPAQPPAGGPPPVESEEAAARRREFEARRDKRNRKRILREAARAKARSRRKAASDKSAKKKTTEVVTLWIYDPLRSHFVPESESLPTAEHPSPSKHYHGEINRRAPPEVLVKGNPVPDKPGITVGDVMCARESRERLPLAQQLAADFAHRFPLAVCLLALYRNDDSLARAAKWLTDHGDAASRMPAAPLVGRMVLRSQTFGAPTTAAMIALSSFYVTRHQLVLVVPPNNGKWTQDHWLARTYSLQSLATQPRPGQLVSDRASGEISPAAVNFAFDFRTNVIWSASVDGRTVVEAYANHGPAYDPPPVSLLYLPRQLQPVARILDGDLPHNSAIQSFTAGDHWRQCPSAMAERLRLLIEERYSNDGAPIPPSLPAQSVHTATMPLPSPTEQWLSRTPDQLLHSMPTRKRVRTPADAATFITAHIGRLLKHRPLSTPEHNPLAILALRLQHYEGAVSSLMDEREKHEEQRKAKAKQLAEVFQARSEARAARIIEEQMQQRRELEQQRQRGSPPAEFSFRHRSPSPPPVPHLQRGQNEEPSLADVVGLQIGDSKNKSSDIETRLHQVMQRMERCTQQYEAMQKRVHVSELAEPAARRDYGCFEVDEGTLLAVRDMLVGAVAELAESKDVELNQHLVALSLRLLFVHLDSIEHKLAEDPHAVNEELLAKLAPLRQLLLDLVFEPQTTLSEAADQADDSAQHPIAALASRTLIKGLRLFYAAHTDRIEFLASLMHTIDDPSRQLLLSNLLSWYASQPRVASELPETGSDAWKKFVGELVTYSTRTFVDEYGIDLTGEDLAPPPADFQAGDVSPALSLLVAISKDLIVRSNVVNQDKSNSDTDGLLLHQLFEFSAIVLPHAVQILEQLTAREQRRLEADPSVQGADRIFLPTVLKRSPLVLVTPLITALGSDAAVADVEHHLPLISLCRRVLHALDVFVRALSPRSQPSNGAGLYDTVYCDRLLTEDTQEHVLETHHPYQAGHQVFKQTLTIPGARAIALTFDPRCRSVNQLDQLRLYRDSSLTSAFDEFGPYWGCKPQSWPREQSVIIPGSQVTLLFSAKSPPKPESMHLRWGFRCVARGLMLTTIPWIFDMEATIAAAVAKMASSLVTGQAVPRTVDLAPSRRLQLLVHGLEPAHLPTPPVVGAGVALPVVGPNASADEEFGSSDATAYVRAFLDADERLAVLLECMDRYEARFLAKRRIEMLEQEHRDLWARALRGIVAAMLKHSGMLAAVMQAVPLAQGSVDDLSDDLVLRLRAVVDRATSVQEWMMWQARMRNNWNGWLLRTVPGAPDADDDDDERKADEDDEAAPAEPPADPLEMDEWVEMFETQHSLDRFCKLQNVPLEDTPEGREAARLTLYHKLKEQRRQRELDGTVDELRDTSLGYAQTARAVLDLAVSLLHFQPCWETPVGLNTQDAATSDDAGLLPPDLERSVTAPDQQTSPRAASAAAVSDDEDLPLPLAQPTLARAASEQPSVNPLLQPPASTHLDARVEKLRTWLGEFQQWRGAQQEHEEDDAAQTASTLTRFSPIRAVLAFVKQHVPPGQLEQAASDSYVAGHARLCGVQEFNQALELVKHGVGRVHILGLLLRGLGRDAHIAAGLELCTRPVLDALAVEYEKALTARLPYLESIWRNATDEDWANTSESTQDVDTASSYSLSTVLSLQDVYGHEFTPHLASGLLHLQRRFFEQLAESVSLEPLLEHRLLKKGHADVAVEEALAANQAYSKQPKSPSPSPSPPQEESETTMRKVAPGCCRAIVSSVSWSALRLMCLQVAEWSPERLRAALPMNRPAEQVADLCERLTRLQTTIFRTLAHQLRVALVVAVRMYERHRALQEHVAFRDRPSSAVDGLQLDHVLASISNMLVFVLLIVDRYMALVPSSVGEAMTRSLSVTALGLVRHAQTGFVPPRCLQLARRLARKLWPSLSPATLLREADLVHEIQSFALPGLAQFFLDEIGRLLVGAEFDDDAEATKPEWLTLALVQDQERLGNLEAKRAAAAAAAAAGEEEDDEEDDEEKEKECKEDEDGESAQPASSHPGAFCVMSHCDPDLSAEESLKVWMRVLKERDMHEVLTGAQGSEPPSEEQLRKQAELDYARRQTGRTGPKVVHMQVASGQADIQPMDNHGGQNCRSNAGFSTLMADVYVSTGRYYFEMKCATAGVMQVGWARSLHTPDCSQGAGVGDDRYSWAYDGCRVRKWHAGNVPYGRDQRWRPGSVVGCALDCEKGEMRFFLDGKPLGVAFSGADLGDGVAPAVSLSHHEACTMVFDPAQMSAGLPMGFAPLQNDAVQDVSGFTDLQLLSDRAAELSEGADTGNVRVVIGQHDFCQDVATRLAREGLTVTVLPLDATSLLIPASHLAPNRGQDRAAQAVLACGEAEERGFRPPRMDAFAAQSVASEYVALLRSLLVRGVHRSQWARAVMDALVAPLQSVQALMEEADEQLSVEALEMQLGRGERQRLFGSLAVLGGFAEVLRVGGHAVSRAVLRQGITARASQDDEDDADGEETSRVGSTSSLVLVEHARFGSQSSALSVRSDQFGRVFPQTSVVSEHSPSELAAVSEVRMGLDHVPLSPALLGVVCALARLEPSSASVQSQWLSSELRWRSVLALQSLLTEASSLGAVSELRAKLAVMIPALLPLSEPVLPVFDHLDHAGDAAELVRLHLWQLRNRVGPHFDLLSLPASSALHKQQAIKASDLSSEMTQEQRQAAIEAAIGAVDWVYATSSFALDESTTIVSPLDESGGSSGGSGGGTAQGNKILSYWERFIIPRIQSYVKGSFQEYERAYFFESLRQPLRRGDSAAAIKIAYTLCNGHVPEGVTYPGPDFHFDALSTSDLQLGDKVQVHASAKLSDCWVPHTMGHLVGRVAHVVGVLPTRNLVLLQFYDDALASLERWWLDARSLTRCTDALALDRTDRDRDVQATLTRFMQAHERWAKLLARRAVLKLSASPPFFAALAQLQHVEGAEAVSAALAAASFGVSEAVELSQLPSLGQARRGYEGFVDRAQAGLLSFVFSVLSTGNTHAAADDLAAPTLVRKRSLGRHRASPSMSSSSTSSSLSSTASGTMHTSGFLVDTVSRNLSEAARFTSQHRQVCELQQLQPKAGGGGGGGLFSTNVSVHTERLCLAGASALVVMFSSEARLLPSAKLELFADPLLRQSVCTLKDERKAPIPPVLVPGDSLWIRATEAGMLRGQMCVLPLHPSLGMTFWLVQALVLSGEGGGDRDGMDEQHVAVSEELCLRLCHEIVAQFELEDMQPSPLKECLLCLLAQVLTKAACVREQDEDAHDRERVVRLRKQVLGELASFRTAVASVIEVEANADRVSSYLQQLLAVVSATDQGLRPRGHDVAELAIEVKDPEEEERRVEAEVDEEERAAEQAALEEEEEEQRAMEAELSQADIAAAARPEGWACPLCTFINPFALPRCEMCGTEQPAVRPSMPSAVAAVAAAANNAVDEAGGSAPSSGSSLAPQQLLAGQDSTATAARIFRHMSLLVGAMRHFASPDATAEDPVASLLLSTAHREVKLDRLDQRLLVLRGLPQAPRKVLAQHVAEFVQSLLSKPSDAGKDVPLAFVDADEIVFGIDPNAAPVEWPVLSMPAVSATKSVPEAQDEERRVMVQWPSPSGCSTEQLGEGVLYCLATRNFSEEWVNPHDAGRVVVSMSQVLPGCSPPSVVAGRTAERCLSVGEDGAWVQVFFPTARVRPTFYQLRHFSGSRSSDALRSWVFEASADGGETWSVLRVHEDDETLEPHRGAVATWAVPPGDGTFFSTFRVRMTGPNSSGRLSLACSGLELYGELAATDLPERPLPQATSDETPAEPKASNVFAVFELFPTEAGLHELGESESNAQADPDDPSNLGGVRRARIRLRRKLEEAAGTRVFDMRRVVASGQPCYPAATTVSALPLKRAGPALWEAYAESVVSMRTPLERAVAEHARVAGEGKQESAHELSDACVSAVARVFEIAAREAGGCIVPAQVGPWLVSSKGAEEVLYASVPTAQTQGLASAEEAVQFVAALLCKGGWHGWVLRWLMEAGGFDARLVRHAEPRVEDAARGELRLGDEHSAVELAALLRSLAEQRHRDDVLALSPSELPVVRASDLAGYPHLQRALGDDVSGLQAVLRLRFQLLRRFNALLGAALPFIDLRHADDARSVAGLLQRCRPHVLSHVKEAFFSSVLDATARATERPTISLDRVAFRRPRSTPIDFVRETCFGSAFTQLRQRDAATLRPKRPGGTDPFVAFQVVLTGEHAVGDGGPWRQFFTDVSGELQSVDELRPSPLLVPCPNAQAQTGDNRNKFMLRPVRRAGGGGLERHQVLELFEFLGVLFGLCVRTGVRLALDLPSFVWKPLVGQKLLWSDLEAVDVLACSYLRQLEVDDAPDVGALTFSTKLSDGSVVELKPGGAQLPVRADEVREYVELVLQARFNEHAEAVSAIRRGMGKTLPLQLLHLLDWTELEELVCGRPEVDIELLRRHTQYSAPVSESSPHIRAFWRVLRELPQEQRRRFLRFAWAQERLPSSDAEMERLHVRLLIKPSPYAQPDRALPRADTCFFNLELPAYSSQAHLRRQLLYAINTAVTMNADENVQDLDGASGAGGNVFHAMLQ